MGTPQWSGTVPPYSTVLTMRSACLLLTLLTTEVMCDLQSDLSMDEELMMAQAQFNVNLGILNELEENVVDEELNAILRKNGEKRRRDEEVRYQPQPLAPSVHDMEEEARRSPEWME